MDTWKGFDPFVVACMEDDHETITTLWNVVSDWDLQHALYLAGKYSNMETFELVISHPRAYPNKVSLQSALTGVFMSDNTDKLRLLLEHETRPLDLTTFGVYPRTWTPLTFACIHGATNCVELLLSDEFIHKYDINVSSENHSESPLYVAASLGKVGMVEVMTRGPLKYAWDYGKRRKRWRALVPDILNSSITETESRVFTWTCSWFSRTDARGLKCLDIIQNAEMEARENPQADVQDPPLLPYT